MTAMMTTRTTADRRDFSRDENCACYIARVAFVHSESRKMRLRTWITAAIAVVASACSETTETHLRGGVAVSFATRTPTITAPAGMTTLAAAFDDTIIAGNDTLVITRAQLVLSEIELKQVETSDCDVEPEPAGCEEIEVGPVLVDLPLDPGAAQRLSVELPPGTYSRIDFEVHKPSDDEPQDQAFLIQHPDFADLSIRVEGTFNGTGFTYESDLDVEQELDLVPPLLVDDVDPTNVTIFVDVDTWFRSPVGGLLDPDTGNKGGDNESEIKENIKQSLKAFEDEDGDGSDED